jgi:hypothetical protein
MTRNRKRIYLLGLFAIFIVVIPVLILYSSGYRLDSRFRLVKTGGIYLVNNESDIIVRLDQKTVKKAGMFDKNILIRELTPRTYYMVVEKAGYRKWKKRINVEEQKVQICYPLLIPLELNPQRIPKYVPGTAEKGKKNREISTEYPEAMKLFSTPDKPVKGMTTKRKENRAKEHELVTLKRLNKKVVLFRQDNGIYVEWTGMNEKRPFFIKSSGKQPAFFPQKRIVAFDFFPGRYDSMLVLLENLELYGVEIDRRFNVHNIYKLLSNCSRFAVKDEILYYLSGGNMYKIDFESNSALPAVATVSKASTAMRNP